MFNIEIGRRLVVLLMMLLVMLLAFSSRSQCIVETGDPSQLTFQLDTGKTKFVLYEPVIVTYTLVNPTDAIIESNVRMSFAGGNLKIFIAYEDQELREFNSGIIGETLGTPSVVHPRRSSMVGDVRMFFNDLTNDLAFPRTGRYKIHGKMYLGNFPAPTFVEAGSVQIEVVRPQDADLKVIETLGTEENLVILLRDGPEAYCKAEANPKCLERLLSFPKEFSNSAYAPTITILLAGTLGLKGLGTGPRHDLQARMLEDFLSRWPNHPLGPRVTTSLVASLRDLGKEKEAMDWVDRFERRYPGRSSPRRLIEEANSRK